MNWLRLISFGWLGNSAEPKALPPREAETTDWTRALAPRESVETAGPEGLGRASQMARMKRGVGYCENTECEDYAKGVFLLNHGDTFYCPRCRQLGKPVGTLGGSPIPAVDVLLPRLATGVRMETASNMSVGIRILYHSRLGFNMVP